MNLEKTLDEILKDEGFRRYAYKDSRGYLTIGHGILIDYRAKGGITEDESKYIVRNRVNKLHQAVSTRWKWSKELSEARRSALVQMAFNLGVGGLNGFMRMLMYLKKGDYSLAADEALDSLWAEQVGDRANRIADLIRYG